MHQYEGQYGRLLGFKFQFPSNGKAYMHQHPYDYGSVRRYNCFNSLQTGRHICTPIPMLPQTVTPAFQFPSNGKAYMHILILVMVSSATVGLFQFPSNGKAYMHIGVGNPIDQENRGVSIPFKREGIYAQSTFLKRRKPMKKVSIPFKREGIYARSENSSG